MLRILVYFYPAGNIRVKENLNTLECYEKY